MCVTARSVRKCASGLTYLGLSPLSHEARIVAAWKSAWPRSHGSAGIGLRFIDVSATSPSNRQVMTSRRVLVSDSHRANTVFRTDDVAM